MGIRPHERLHRGQKVRWNLKPAISLATGNAAGPSGVRTQKRSRSEIRKLAITVLRQRGMEVNERNIHELLSGKTL